MSMMSLESLRIELARGRTTSRALLETCLERALDPDGEGARTFLHIDVRGARLRADSVDAWRQKGQQMSPYAGLVVSVKDLFDVAGQVTAAGSWVLSSASPAHEDAFAVARLKAAGLIIIGRTNMSEFAYTGIGLNPHYGTPANPFERALKRIPGGSSSGAAISVTDGMAAAGLGTDTGGSCRIPAALTGISGFKPSASRVNGRGVFGLSKSLDSVGVLAPDAGCCAIIDSIVAGTDIRLPAEINLRGVKFGVPQTLVLDGLDQHVAQTYSAVLKRLHDAGAELREMALDELAEVATINRRGAIVAFEAYALHQEILRTRADQYDPNVRARIENGALYRQADYEDACNARRDWITRVQRRMQDVDLLICPTVPIIAPTFSQVADNRDFQHFNLLLLRNPMLANFLDGCSVSIPCHEPGTAPVGLMLIDRHGRDESLLSVAQSVQRLLRSVENRV
ncbi:amidase [Pseudomonas sp. Irchel s3b2]|uniref:amidase n=1 Tax=Pseudomonas sp. Irchel s3b2 TaxID=2009073 RepID=UPI000BA40A52|nr:amidase [Pseudomonas sp. Irchel s3b2]